MKRSRFVVLAPATLAAVVALGINLSIAQSDKPQPGPPMGTEAQPALPSKTDQAKPEPARPAAQNHEKQARPMQDTAGEKKPERPKVSQSGSARQDRKNPPGVGSNARQNERQNSAGAGSPAAKPAPQISQQQRTQIQQKVTSLHVERVTHVDFPITVGTVVPQTVTVYEMPPEIVQVVPAYSGFEYLLVGDEFLIVDPLSLQIVAVLPV